MKKKNTKIAIIWENLQYGGMNTFIENLINSKKFRILKINLITNKNNEGIDNLNYNIKNKNYKLIVYKSLISHQTKNLFIKSVIWAFKPILLVISFIQMFKILNNIKPDLVMAASGGYGGFRTDAISLIAAKLLKIKIRILSIHHCYTKPIAWKFFLKLIDILIKNSTTHFVFGSRAVKNDIKKKTNLINNNIKFKIIHHGVSLNRNNKNKINLRKIFKTDRNILKIGMLSRVEKNKGHYDLINAFYNLSSHLKKKIKVFFIGPIDELNFKKLNILLSKFQLHQNFQITGFLNCDSLKIIKKLDLIISLTKNFEGFGLSIAEALAAKKPVLSTNVGAVTEFLNNKNSKLIPPNNLNIIKNSLEDFYYNEKKWKKRAIIGYKKIIKNFSSENTAKKYFDIFDLN